jgi:23S rRNA (uracil1939-C5)-methyltransferase
MNRNSPDASVITLALERPVAGGRMLARHEGRVVLVSGGIPGERVSARVERVKKQVMWAEVVEVIDPSPDRRESPCDLACGGSTYAHMTYARQIACKAAVIADAFSRIAKAPLETLVVVRESPEDGYRLRARVHLDGTRWGFLREGTRTLCDAASTRQLLPSTVAAIDAVRDVAPGLFLLSSAISVAENVPASERVLHFELKAGHRLPGADDFASVFGSDHASALMSVSGVTIGSSTGDDYSGDDDSDGQSHGLDHGSSRVLMGDPSVRDTAASLFGATSPIDGAVTWSRRATSFFQGNRYRTGALVRRVLEVATGDRVVDLYSGVGLFAVALAASGAHVTAVEGDPSSGADLVVNARSFSDRLSVAHASVEDWLRSATAKKPDVVVLDPPRAGASLAALQGVIALRSARLLYVSCDPPTLARDSARLCAAGYALQSIEAFDLFPNTPHVECVAVFHRSSG